MYDRLRYLANKEGDKYERARNLFARVRQRWTYQQKVLLVDLIRVHGLDYGKLAEGLIMEPSVVCKRQLAFALKHLAVLSDNITAGRRIYRKTNSR